MWPTPRPMPEPRECPPHPRDAIEMAAPDDSLLPAQCSVDKGKGAKAPQGNEFFEHCVLGAKCDFGCLRYEDQGCSMFRGWESLF